MLGLVLIRTSASAGEPGALAAQARPTIGSATDPKATSPCRPRGSQCKTLEKFEAWSKNLGHEHMLTTFRSYGSIDPHRQGELINSIGSERQDKNKLAQLMELVQGLN